MGEDSTTATGVRDAKRGVTKEDGKFMGSQKRDKRIGAEYLIRLSIICSALSLTIEEWTNHSSFLIQERIKGE
jgi:hypothetical protein